MSLNDGNYKATVTGGFLTEKGDAVGLRVSVFFEDGSSQSGTAYLNFYNREGSQNQLAVDAALKIFRAGQPGGLDANTWDNIENVIQQMTDERAQVDIRAYNGKLYVQTGSGQKQMTPEQSSAAKRNLAQLTRGMVQSAPAPTQTAPAQSANRAQLISVLKGMADRKEDWSVITKGRKVKEMTDAEVDAILNGWKNGPDLTTPADDIPF